LPHSGIDGSKPVCGSPSLFAAYHALHRLLAPRHSPYALSSLTIRTRTDACLTSDFRLRTTGISSRSLSPAVRSPTRVSSVIHTACVWSENYRCRIFSCQRALETYFRFQTLLPVDSTSRGNRRSKLQPSRPLSCAACGPPPLLRSYGGQPSPGLPTVAHAPVGKRERRLVENTGLEPVTSWLQTRRSPS
jgi:hypothetical protein